MKFVVSLFVLLLAPGTTNTAEQTLADQPKPKLTNQAYSITRLLAEQDEKDLAVTVRQLMAERGDLEGHLMEQLGSAISDNGKIAAVYLLGLYRMEHSVDALAKILSLEDVMGHPLLGPRYNRYPVVTALIKIGTPSIRPMLKSIETSTDDLVRTLATQVIRAIDGVTIAKVRIEEAIARQSNPEKKKNLQTALTLLQESK